MLKRTLSAAIFATLVSPASAVMAAPNAGPYLAARQASIENDFAAAGSYFTKGLISDPTNAFLLENAMTSYIALGQIDRALPIAKVIVAKGYESQIANLALNLEAAKTGDWEQIFSALEGNRSVGPLVDGLSQAWAHLGLGDVNKALANFDQVIETEGLRVYGLNHKALALASVGDFEGADAIFATPTSGGMRYSRRSAIAHAQVLSQLGRNEDAIAVIDGIFNTPLDKGVSALRETLVAGNSVAYDAVSDPLHGLAEVYYVVANALQGDAPDAYTLLYVRAATYLVPENTEALLLTAGLLESLGQYDLANTTYSSVSRDDPAFQAAELGRADALRSAGRNDAAIEVLEALARTHPEQPLVHATAGNTLRQADRYNDARKAYTRAIDLYDDKDPAKWFVYYTRGITNHLLDEWTAAEADFRAALALRPDQPQVLNYLGYSLVERGDNLDEALGMIETAAATQPDNGAIIDSLGWVMFQLGRFEDAVSHMERAATLEPIDPIINDHLGDAYWAVGREIEAHFQWQRALSFNPSDEEAARIRSKLESGLDAVLIEEGEDPIRVARGNN